MSTPAFRDHLIWHGLTMTQSGMAAIQTFVGFGLLWLAAGGDKEWFAVGVAGWVLIRLDRLLTAEDRREKQRLGFPGERRD